MYAKQWLLVSFDRPCHLFQTGEKVDARDLSMGAWFEAQVVKVTKEASPADQLGDQPGSSTDSTNQTETIYYHVRYDE